MTEHTHIILGGCYWTWDVLGGASAGFALVLGIVVVISCLLFCGFCVTDGSIIQYP